MADEKDIPKPPPDDETGEITIHHVISIDQPETQSKDMEVHHHPNLEKKSFKEYSLEFLMIFLAVTMGFFAESLREHMGDKSKEREYMYSLVVKDPVRLNQLANSFINYKSRNWGYKTNVNQANKMAADLIELLNKEYPAENE